MSDLESLEKEMKLLKHKAARAELLHRSAKMKEDIDRIQDHIKQQEELIKELE